MSQIARIPGAFREHDHEQLAIIASALIEWMHRLYVDRVCSTKERVSEAYDHAFIKQSRSV